MPTKINLCVAANTNADGQVVLSGHLKAIEKAVEIASEFGAKRCIKLPGQRAFSQPADAAGRRSHGPRPDAG